MNISRIRTIIDKEWAEVFKNRLVLFTVAFLPIIFTLLPLVIFYATSRGGPGAGDLADLPPSFAQLCSTVGATDCLQIYILNEFLLLFMFMPLIIPISIAAYSIVGEKTTRSLEPLLATPISTEELLTAKGLAAVLPAILACWTGFAVFVIGLPLVGASSAVLQVVLGPVWLLSVLGVGPLIAIMAVVFATMISSRVNDPRVAEQVSAVLVVPLIAVLFGQLAGLVVLSATTVLIAMAVMVVIDIALVYLAARLFQREVILTRWK
jgi:ABC-2 type transport system permease protein